VFSGIGDANPSNVAPAMVTCLLRLAETRAKARAMRDAVNVGVAAFEELGAEEDGGTADLHPRETVRRAAPRPSHPAASPTSPISDAQAQAIRSLCARWELDVDEVSQQQYNFALVNLTQAQA